MKKNKKIRKKYEESEEGKEDEEESHEEVECKLKKNRMMEKISFYQLKMCAIQLDPTLRRSAQTWAMCAVRAVLAGAETV